jgi:hypothetical protein
VSNDKKKEKLCFLPRRCPFSKPSPTFRPSTCSGAKQTHGLKRPKKIGEKRGPVDPEVLIFINNSPRRHHLEEFLKEDPLRVPVSPAARRTQPNNTTWGGLQTSFARVAYVTQQSRIGIDELAYLISFTSVETENTRR